MPKQVVIIIGAATCERPEILMPESLLFIPLWNKKQRILFMNGPLVS